MKLKNILYICLAASLSLGACSDWTEEERVTYENQEGLERLVPLIEAQGEEDLTPTQREYYAKLREYRNTPHVKGFGWFGNWTGKGTNAQNYLKMLPDSVDFVSLWGARGNLSDEQKADLKFFQEVKGGKVLLCWIIDNLGVGITPEGVEDRREYWLQKGGGDETKAIEAYANALCDTIDKYNLDGFDIDYEPGYRHDGDLANTQTIAENSGNTKMWTLIKTMSDRLRPQGKMLVMDGEPYFLSPEASEMIDHYIYQAYHENSTAGVMLKIKKGEHLKDWERKTIITVEFEQYWRTGGVARYTSADHPEFSNKDGGQIFDYATLDLPSGKRIGGIGSYHMEYDFKNEPPYKWLRTALYYGNVVYPGDYQQ